MLAGKIFSIANAWDDESILHTMLLIDILQFAGMAYLIHGLVQAAEDEALDDPGRSHPAERGRNPVFGGGANLPDAMQDIIGSCIFTAVEPAFPAFQWYIYPALGLCFAHLLRHVTDKRRFI